MGNHRQVEEQLSVPEIARRLSVSERQAWRWAGAGKFGPPLKLSHKITRYPASGVNRFLESRKVE